MSAMPDILPPAATPLGLVVLGVATGLDPMLMVAGGAGAMWAQFYLPEMPLAHRAISIILGAMVAAWVSPAVALALPSLPGWPSGLGPDVVILPSAITAGLLFHSAGGIALRLLAERLGARRDS